MLEHVGECWVCLRLVYKKYDRATLSFNQKFKKIILKKKQATKLKRQDIVQYEPYKNANIFFTEQKKSFIPVLVYALGKYNSSLLIIRYNKWTHLSKSYLRKRYQSFHAHGV